MSTHSPPIPNRRSLHRSPSQILGLPESRSPAGPRDAQSLDPQPHRRLHPRRPHAKSASPLPPPLDRSRLIRRVTFDLTGLPPSPADVDAFLKDKSPDAYEKVVDRLLASPAYGERWAAKWLDVVRYADTNGFELDLERPNAWRYRDYVIHSFQTDKPYDRFIREQIAGDEMFPGDREALIATGYLRAGSEHLVSGNIDPEESRQEVLTEIATNVGQTFLGMTINCARCHNHKFDPILQRDFYALQSDLRRRQRQGRRDRRRRTKRPPGRPRRRPTRSACRRSKTALKALAKPFDEQLREERKRQLDPKLREALDIPKDKRTAGTEAPGLGRRDADQAGLGRNRRRHAARGAGRARQPARAPPRSAKPPRPIRWPPPMPSSTPARTLRKATYCVSAIRTAGSTPWTPPSRSCSRPATRFPPHPPAAAPPSPTGSPRRKIRSPRASWSIASGSSAWAMAWCARPTISAPWETSPKATRSSTGSPPSSSPANGASRPSTA